MLVFCIESVTVNKVTETRGETDIGGSWCLGPERRPRSKHIVATPLMLTGVEIDFTYSRPDCHSSGKSWPIWLLFTGWFAHPYLALGGVQLPLPVLQWSYSTESN